MFENFKKLTAVVLALILLIQVSTISVVQAKEPNTTFKSTIENIIQDGGVEAGQTLTK